MDFTLPEELRMLRACRAWCIYEGPSEVHRWFIARGLLRNGMPAD